MDVSLCEQNIKFLNDLAMYTLESRSSVLDSIVSMVRDQMGPDQIKECVDMFKVDGRRK